MTATQAPTPGPLTSESVKLLVKGDLLWAAVHGAPVTVIEAVGASVSYRHPEYAPDGCVIVGKGLEWLAFIGRPDESGWMPWSGGENPVPGQRVELRLKSGITLGVYASEEIDWSCPRRFRLAPTAPVEASGETRDGDLLRRAKGMKAIGAHSITVRIDELEAALLSARPLALGGQQGEKIDRAWLIDIINEHSFASDAADMILERLSTTPARAEAQSAADQVRKLTPREERLGGQTFKYVMLADVLDILEDRA